MGQDPGTWGRTREREAQRPKVPQSRPEVPQSRGGRGGRSVAALPGSGRGPAMEAGEQRARLRREAAEYYRGLRVPERMEQALNELFLQRPEDLYGELVARAGHAAGRAVRAPVSLAALALSGDGVSVVMVLWFAPDPGRDCDGSVFVASGTGCYAKSMSSAAGILVLCCVSTQNQSSPQMESCLSLTKLLLSCGDSLKRLVVTLQLLMRGKRAPVEWSRIRPI